MIRLAALAIAATVAGCAAKPDPCPEGQARDNGGTCVAIAVPQQSLEDFDPFPQAATAPSKSEYVEEGGVTFVQSPTLDAENAKRQAEWDATRERLRAEQAADARADRIVDAQRDTQRAVQELRDEVRR